MKRTELKNKTDKVVSDTHDALQFVIDELNKGQVQKLIKNPELKALFDRYSVDYEK